MAERSWGSGDRKTNTPYHRVDIIHGRTQRNTEEEIGKSGDRKGKTVNHKGHEGTQRKTAETHAKLGCSGTNREGEGEKKRSGDRDIGKSGD
jgi:hypothetical protein